MTIALMENKWEIIEQKREANKTIFKVEITLVEDIDFWSEVRFKQYIIVTRETEWDFEKQEYTQRFFVLFTTKRYQHPTIAIARYRLRTKIEERFRQFKHDWYICKFPSPHTSLIESHVCFTLLTYSLLQLYLYRKDLQDKTKQMIASLRQDESLGKDAVLVYSNSRYGVFDLDDYTVRVASMEEMARQKLKTIMEAQKEARLKRNYSV
jgi:hypothetical protein